MTKKIICGQCGTTFVRKKSKNGFVTWSCLKHVRNASACPVGRIPESKIYAAFMTMYGKLKRNSEEILRPAISQLREFSEILKRRNPEILAVYREIAEMTEKNYKLTRIRSAGLIDEDVLAAKLREINAKITRLRRDRRMILKNQDIEDLIENLTRLARLIENGPENPETFDGNLFAELVESVTAVSETCLRFRLYGGIELTERIQEGKI